jgi:hypothetical protein
MITLDMVGFSSLTAYLSRQMTREEASKLTKGEMKARRLAQIRTCRHRQKMADLLADVARHDAHRAPGRDIIDLSPVIIDA